MVYSIYNQGDIGEYNMGTLWAHHVDDAQAAEMLKRLDAIVTDARPGKLKEARGRVSGCA